MVSCLAAGFDMASNRDESNEGLGLILGTWVEKHTPGSPDCVTIKVQDLLSENKVLER
jgi:hypothetical protein